jgi:hypothetical protein
MTNPIHKTGDGHIELLDQWGHGRHAHGKWHARPATLTSDDGDGHYAAWAYTGSKRAAAEVIGSFLVGSKCGFAQLEHDTVVYYSEGSPEGDSFYKLIGNDEFGPDLEKYPNAVAW